MTAPASTGWRLTLHPDIAFDGDEIPSREVPGQIARDAHVAIETVGATWAGRT